ncbi:hypothetical protein JI742_05000 [Piscinibacter sp. Jin2]|uniref:FlgO domain-containing protein n=1 Tax=Aquariibacter lacus TaxID=2801332 RepID=A0A9X0XDW1_9BURK|nr:FlgO family outer membrane protein [Piscinibacter lacus]MBL0719243.1 hypothetical protein [Piscinibacter lacus]
MPANPRPRRPGLMPCLLALGLGACAALPPPAPPATAAPASLSLPSASRHADDLTRSNEQAADELATAWRQSGFGFTETVLISSLVALDDLKKSSPLGRLVAEQVAGRLAQHGLGVKEVRLREGLVIRADQGELMLSRDAAELARQHQAHVALIGAYTRSREATRITLRLVRLDDARVIAAANYVVKVDERTDALLPLGPTEASASEAATTPPRRTLYDSIRDYDRGQPSLHY